MSDDTTNARFELALLNSEISDYSQIDVVTRLTNQGLSQEIITRLEALWDLARTVGGKVINLGKIIIFEIMKFVDEHPHFAIGAAMGAAVGSLINMVPFLGQALTPLAMALGAFIGGVAGARLDRGLEPGDGYLGIAQEVILAARRFFELLVSILSALKSELSVA